VNAFHIQPDEAVIFEISNGAAIKETRLKRFPVRTMGFTDPETPPHFLGAPFGKAFTGNGHLEIPLYPIIYREASRQVFVYSYQDDSLQPPQWCPAKLIHVQQRPE
jgi:hypothetical protein